MDQNTHTHTTRERLMNTCGPRPLSEKRRFSNIHRTRTTDSERREYLTHEFNHCVYFSQKSAKKKEEQQRGQLTGLCRHLNGLNVAAETSSSGSTLWFWVLPVSSPIKPTFNEVTKQFSSQFSLRSASILSLSFHCDTFSCN